MQLPLFTQWLSSRSAPGPGGARRLGSRCLRAWGLALWLGLMPGCAPRKETECARVQSQVLEEMRVVDSFHDHVHDGEAIARHAQRLRSVSADLRAIRIHDDRLRLAVEHYGASIDQLAGAWVQFADSRRAALTDGGTEAGVPVGVPTRLQELLTAHAAVMNGTRSAISDICEAR